MNFSLGIWLGIISLLGFGITNFLLGIVSRKTGSFRSALWFEVISLFLLLFLSIFFLKNTSIQPNTILLVVVTALIGVIPIVSFAKGLQVGNISIVTPVANAWGAIAVILSYIFLNEVLNTVQILSIILIIIGTIVASTDIKNLGSYKKNLFTDKGIKYAIVTVLGWGIFFFLTSIIVGKIGWFLAALSTTLAIVVFMLIYGIIAKIDMKPKAQNFKYLIPVGLLGGTAFLAYNLGVTVNYVSLVAPITAASPIATVILALFILKEKLKSNQKLGIILVIIGLIALSL